MKALILAAGEGTRLRPLTNDLPKCLVPINGQPLLGIWLHILKGLGVTEVLVNLHWKAEQVREYVQRHGLGLKIHLSEEPRLLGTAGTLRAHREWLSDGEDFWIIFADVLTSSDLKIGRAHV